MTELHMTGTTMVLNPADPPGMVWAVSCRCGWFGTERYGSQDEARAAGDEHLGIANSDAPTEHRPTGEITVDVFVDDASDESPRTVAEDAWQQIRQWVWDGYLPVVTVRLADGTSADVDLEEDAS